MAPLAPVIRIRRAPTLDQVTSPTLVIHDTRIPLADDADVQGLIEEILAGIRSGGAVVHVAGRFGREYDLIVSPATRALVCHGVVASGDHSDDGPWIAGDDLDY